MPQLASKTLVAGVVDGRNIWRTDLQSALAQLATLLGSAASVAVSTSCSTLHVPYSLEPETGLDDALRSCLAFGAEKVREVATLARALADGREAVAEEIAASDAAVASRTSDPRPNGLLRHQQRLGTVLRQPLRAPAGAVRVTSRDPSR